MERKQKLEAWLAVALLAIVITALAATAIVVAMEGGMTSGVTVYVNDVAIRGVDIHGNPKAFIYNGTTYVAVATIGKALEQSIVWEEETRSVYVGGYAKKPIIEKGGKQ